MPSIPQTESAAYKLAFQDTDFLLREDLRPVRFQLELLKPELLLNEANIGSTFVFYGSARIPAPDKADALIAAATNAEQRADRRAAEGQVALLRRRATSLRGSPAACGCDEDGKRHFVVCSGGGPSIMEAANRGAADEGQESIGLNIVLPHEQLPNPYVTPDLSFQFHYFALRKMHFLLRARAVAVFPGGFGTFDEMFELLTLIQTGKVRPLPILLFGREFWNRVVDFEALVEEGVISPHDLDLIHWSEDAEKRGTSSAAITRRTRGRCRQTGPPERDSLRAFSRSPARRRSTAASPPTFLGFLPACCSVSTGSGRLRPGARLGRGRVVAGGGAAGSGMRRVAVRVEERDHVGAVLRIAEAGEGHLGAGREFLRAGQPLAEIVPVPGAALLGERRRRKRSPCPGRSARRARPTGSGRAGWRRPCRHCGRRCIS